MLAVGDLGGQFIPLCRIAAESRCDRDVLVNGPRRRAADFHHVENGGRMPATHHLADESHDRNIMSQALQDRIAARPADAIKHDVALADRSDKTICGKSRQENTVFSGVKTDSPERALEPGSKRLGDAPAT